MLHQNWKLEGHQSIPNSKFAVVINSDIGLWVGFVTQLSGFTVIQLLEALDHLITHCI